MTEISIIVPVYNVEQYLENCIQSILNQTFKNYELILVDDGSTDKSGEICDKYEKIDNRIKVIHKDNGGLSSARNSGLDIACGKYIGFVDSDDSIHPRMYEILYDLIKKHNVDISCCNYRETYSICNEYDTNIESAEVIEMDNIQAINNLYNNDICIRLVVAWNKLYSKHLFNDIYYEVGRIHEDEFIAHRILHKCKKIVYTNNELYYYLQREGSIMSKESYKRDVDKILAFSDRVKFFYKVGLKDMCSKASIIYIKKFFNIYNEIELSDSNNLLLKTLRNDFISNIYILLKLKSQGIKAKILWISFCLSSKIYSIYINSKTNKIKNF